MNTTAIKIALWEVERRIAELETARTVIQKIIERKEKNHAEEGSRKITEKC
jgi:hypothetical protein